MSLKSNKIDEILKKKKTRGTGYFSIRMLVKQQYMRLETVPISMLSLKPWKK